MAFLDTLFTWLKDNIVGLIIAAIVLVVLIVINKIVKRQLKKLVRAQKLEEDVARNIGRLFKIFLILVLLIAIFSLFAEALSLVVTMFTLVGGTILGFAAINTIGNAIAGIIIMTSKPIRVGDRIMYSGSYCDVEAIDFMYTKLKMLDNTMMWIPNQELMKNSIINYGKGDIPVARTIKLTLDYSLNSAEIIPFLTEIVSKVDGVLEDPKPSTVISGFPDYAVEYSTFYRVAGSGVMFTVDSRVRQEVFKACKEKGYDLSVPSLYKKVD